MSPWSRSMRMRLLFFRWWLSLMNSKMKKWQVCSRRNSINISSNCLLVYWESTSVPLWWTMFDGSRNRNIHLCININHRNSGTFLCFRVNHSSPNTKLLHEFHVVVHTWPIGWVHWFPCLACCSIWMFYVSFFEPLVLIRAFFREVVRMRFPTWKEPVSYEN